MEHTKGTLTENQNWTLKDGSTCHKLLPTRLCTIAFISRENSFTNIQVYTDYQRYINTSEEQVSEWFDSSLNIVVYNKTLLSQKRIRLWWIYEWMKTELSQHKLKNQTLACLCFYPPFVPPFLFAFNKLELVKVVKPTH